MQNNSSETDKNNNIVGLKGLW